MSVKEEKICKASDATRNGHWRNLEPSKYWRGALSSQSWAARVPPVCMQAIKYENPCKGIYPPPVRPLAASHAFKISMHHTPELANKNLILFNYIFPSIDLNFKSAAPQLIKKKKVSRVCNWSILQKPTASVNRVCSLWCVQSLIYLFFKFISRVTWVIGSVNCSAWKSICVDKLHPLPEPPDLFTLWVGEPGRLSDPFVHGSATVQGVKAGGEARNQTHDLIYLHLSTLWKPAVVISERVDRDEWSRLTSQWNDSWVSDNSFWTCTRKNAVY